jgi:hypothetical protein
VTGMADDDKEKDDGFDPWADLESEGGAELGDGLSFSFEEAELDAGLGEPFAADGTPGEPSPTDGEPAAEETLGSAPLESAGSGDDDAFVNAWLDESAEMLADPPLSLFSPDDSADGDFPAEIESGSEAIVEPAAPPPSAEVAETSESDLDVLGFLDEDGEAEITPGLDHEPAAAAASTDPAAVGEASPAGADEADVLDFGMAAAGMAAVGAAGGGLDAAAEEPALPREVATTKRQKKGGLGQLVGVVLGGLLAIPIVLGILIGLMWFGWRDTVGIRKWMPEQLAFLLPAAPVRVAGPATTGGPDLSTASSLDDLPAVAVEGSGDAASEPATEPAAVEPVVPETAEPDLSEPPAAAATAETSPAPGGESPVMTEAAVETVASEPVASEPGVTEPVDPFASLTSEPTLDGLGAVTVPVEPVMPADEPVPGAEPAALQTAVVAEPEPIDVAALEAAVTEVDAAFEALQSEPGLAGIARKKLLVEWYRGLVHVAQELAVVERMAADSGRPLDAPPAAVINLESRIFAAPDLADDLAKLGRDWLGYARREGDGVVLPATFISTRQVGPYASSRISLAAADGTSREVAVISRSAPAAVEGDSVLVVGLVMDGGVIWASDIRAATAVSAAVEPEPAVSGEPDPFGQREP